MTATQQHAHQAAPTFIQTYVHTINPFPDQDIENPDRKWNDWEKTFYVLFWGSFLLVGLGEAFRHDHGPESWARDEVSARETVLAQDEEVTEKRERMKKLGRLAGSVLLFS